MFHFKPFTLWASLLVFFNSSCQVEKGDPLKIVLASQNPFIRNVMDGLENYEAQIIYTKIHRIKDSVWFQDFTFNVDDSTYFYPASTVKFPIALLALEKLQQDPVFNINSTFYVEGDSVETTFAKEITKIFAVSDNVANNRLFEYLGQDYINRTLTEKGLSPVRISHRLSADDGDNVTTKPLIFYANDSTITQTRAIISSPIGKLDLKKILKGKGFYQEDSLFMEPMDFSFKNYLPLTTLHNTLKRIIFPQAYSKKEQFHLDVPNREFLLKSMSILPKDAGYNATEYHDSYGKFFMFGDSKEPIPKNIKIYNKVGYAYGYLTDCAYIKDEKNNIEFLLSATVYVNKNGIFNDDSYEYGSIGIPFLAALGRQIYNLEWKDR